MIGKLKINTDILDEAIRFATDVHKDVPRKGTVIPYILHPIEAASIVATITTDIEVIAAAVLHDTVEDNKNISIDDIEKKFGKRIGDLVDAESEEKEEDEVGSWTRRKKATIEYLKNKATKDEKIIALGDKLSNMRAIYKDYISIGDELWSRFNQKDKTLHGWYYKGIAEELKILSDYPAYKEYCELVNKVFGD